MTIVQRRRPARAPARTWLRVCCASLLLACPLLGACDGGTAAGPRVLLSRAAGPQTLALSKDAALSWTLDPERGRAVAYRECLEPGCGGERLAAATAEWHGDLYARIDAEAGPSAVGELPAVTVEASRLGQCRQPNDRRAATLAQRAQLLC